MLEFSVLIPTYQRRDKLKKVLEVLSSQVGLSRGEVIVGVDGSQDGTNEMIEEMKGEYPAPLKSFWISNSGRAVIRNQLIDRAQGKILIFIQDDIVVTEHWLLAHLRAQSILSGAVVGHMTWFPEETVTEYMRWLENGGHMLDFRGLKDGDALDFWHFYMGNLSVPKELLGDLRFDASHYIYGWEDIVLGLEFSRRGHAIYYSRDALAYHWDEYREEDLQQYMEKVGASASIVEQSYPGIGFVPGFFKRIILWSLIRCGKVVWSLLPQHLKWYLNMKEWFLEAVQRHSSSPKHESTIS